jgi:hypothetical protein
LCLSLHPIEAISSGSQLQHVLEPRIIMEHSAPVTSFKYIQPVWQTVVDLLVFNNSISPNFKYFAHLTKIVNDVLEVWFVTHDVMTAMTLQKLWLTCHRIRGHVQHVIFVACDVWYVIDSSCRIHHDYHCFYERYPYAIHKSFFMAAAFNIVCHVNI